MEFKIPPQSKNIIVNVSGGVDSALLLYITVKYLQKNLPDANLNVLTCANKAKMYWNGTRASSVVNYVLTKTSFNKFNTHYTFYRPEQENQYFIDMETKLWDSGFIDTRIEGTTKNPPAHVKVIRSDGEKILLREYGGNIEKRNNPTKLQCKTIEESNKIGHLISPWINVDKSFIADQYKKFNLNDELLPLTRSCEARPEKHKHFDQPCGMCWWCLEKKWAFGHF